MLPTLRSRFLRLPLLAVALATVAAPAAAVPVPPGPAGPDIPQFLGTPATANPITGIPPIPQNPYLAPNGDSGVHNDGWMSDTYTRPGPLGLAPQTNSLLLGDLCISAAFDRAGRIVATCLGLDPGLFLIDPATMTVLGKHALEGRSAADVLKPGAALNSGGGVYFYLDNH
ncbi:hypothetical protein ACL02S_24115, partial [Nocardia sp. 004]